MQGSILSVRVDSEVKESFAALCEELGMSASVAVNMFMRQMVRERALPFVPSVHGSVHETASQENARRKLSISEISSVIASALRDCSEVARVTLFGSYARGEATAHSDVDLRVELDEGSSIGVIALSGLKGRIETALGRSVDIVTAEQIDPKLAASIEREGVVVYEREKI